MNGPYTFGLVTDIAIFDLSSQDLQIIDSDAEVESALTWLANEEFLVFAAIDSCDGSPLKCPEQNQLWHIETINLETRETTSSSNISPQLFNIVEGMSVSRLCQLEVSPDGKHLLYKSYCVNEGIHTMDEVFVTDLQSNQTVQLTNFGDIDFSNKYSYVWDRNGEYFIIGYKHDYILDNSRDESGFITYKVNEYESPSFNTSVNNLLMLNATWSPDLNYVLGIVGKDNLTFESMYVGQIINGQVVALSTEMPLLSLNGCWVEDGYISQYDSRLVKLTLPELNIIDLGIILDDGLNLTGCSP